MTPNRVNLAEGLGQIGRQWDRPVVASCNDTDAVVVRFQGEFLRRCPADPDDFSLVPAGMIYRSRTVAEAQVLPIEPKGSALTGDGAAAAVKPRI